MAGLRIKLLKQFLKRLKGGSRYNNIHATRAGFEKTMRLFKSRFAGLHYQPVNISDLKCEWIIPGECAGNKVILFFHGGGYAAGSINTHRQHVSHIAKLTGIKALLFEYRLAPEHPYPAALDDSCAIYQSLIDQGYEPRYIAFAGDSAGGGLCLATALCLRDAQKPLPKVIAVMSAWLNLSLSGKTLTSKKEADPVLVYEGFPVWAKAYLGEAGAESGYASPLFHNLQRLPPVYLQVGEDEMLLSDSQRFAEKAKHDGLDVQLEIFPGMFHVFQGYWRVLGEAKDANKKFASFISNHLNSK